MNQESENKSEPKSEIPQQLLKQKQIEIKNLIKDNKLFEASTIIKELINTYGNDLNVTKFAALNIFRILLKDESLKDNKILQHIFNKSEDNFFDPQLCCLTLGLLLLIKTPTKEKIINEIYCRMVKLDKELLKKVIQSLPKNIYNKELRDKYAKNL